MILIDVPTDLAVPRTSWVRVLKKDPCAYCKRKPARTLDHIKARGKNGDNTMENLTGACHSCNLRKRDRSLLHYLLERK